MPTKSPQCCHRQRDSRNGGAVRACLRKNRGRSLESIVIARGISDGLRMSVRRREFLDRKMQKLNDSRLSALGYHNQTGACQHKGFLVLPALA